MLRLLRIADRVAHVAYCLTTLGHTAARGRWHHRIHLIPGRMLVAICDRYELALGVTPDELRRTT